MIGKFIRLIIGGLVLLGAVALFVTGSIGWGVSAVFVSAFIILLHFKNEMNMIAFFFVRKQDFAKAGIVLSKVKKPENMVTSQEAYYYFLMGLVESQNYKHSKAEKFLKKAISTGLRMDNDQAMAKLNLSGIYLSKRNKKLASYYLKDVKKLDKQKLLTPQIREIETMMKRM